MKTYLSRVTTTISTKELFQNIVNVYFEPTVKNCICGDKLRIYKTKTRWIATLLTGECKAHITQLHCKACKTIYSPDELKLIAPKNSYFGFDILVYIGMELFFNYTNDEKIQESLRKRKISISLREISHLGKVFIVYLSLAHESCQENIKKLMNKKGGYILHFDGTCEGDSPRLFSFIDELTNIVLDNVKIPSEASPEIIPALQKIKESYGNPIAIVHDMSSAILMAVESVFPGVKDFICHYHFLRDIGKDLFSAEYDFIRIALKKHRIRADIRNTVKQLKLYIEKNSDLQMCLNESMGKSYFKENKGQLMPPVSLYLLLTWILYSRGESHGYGFPFDRPHVDFYGRLKESFLIIENLKNEMPDDSPKISLAVLNRTINDISLNHVITLIKERIPLFDELRDAMRIALPESNQGLNDGGGAVKIKTIEAGVRKFKESHKIMKLSKNDFRFKKMIKQIDKYWVKLFADPIQVETNAGSVMIQPQRTNNLLEQFFRNIKSGYRKKSGASSLTRALTTMLQSTPFVKNLNIPEYVEIILDGKKNLAERFSEIDIASVRARFQEETVAMTKRPKGMAKILRMTDFYDKISQITVRRCA